jgi:hypothetical protein
VECQEFTQAQLNGVDEEEGIKL